MRECLQPTDTYPAVILKQYDVSQSYPTLGGCLLNPNGNT